MSDLTLTKIRMRNGRWEGRLTGARTSGARPDVRAAYLDRPVDGVELTESETPGSWELIVPVPEEAVADGVHTVLIYDGATDGKLGDFTLIAGEIANDDLRAEVELLRAELDMLKRVFRRHCLETA
ncbi:hypothetical protein [Pseudodonghicola xiamenensis]|uniref:Uncharacterized protein n=1 Tax=Pseudodonghicola xiamenensis TaxID=337702 RepID=A0A8J3MD95_9RHOB|nr:hypothetical protein [Pseudodonghicola xiamenensis]GHG81823.1 hypothetical protein GCM10010961_05860 [Pseudodonghicola xiamenensis]